jgi:hypothetical protein
MNEDEFIWKLWFGPVEVKTIEPEFLNALNEVTKK